MCLFQRCLRPYNIIISDSFCFVVRFRLITQYFYMATDIGLKRFVYIFTWKFILYLTVLCACTKCFVVYFYNKLYCFFINLMQYELYPIFNPELS